LATSAKIILLESIDRARLSELASGCFPSLIPMMELCGVGPGGACGVGGDHQRLLPTLCRPSSPAASEQSNRELSQKRALALVHHRRINSLRYNDAGPLTRSFTAQNGNVYASKVKGLPAMTATKVPV
jgi:hypothetical protein